MAESPYERARRLNQSINVANNYPRVGGRGANITYSAVCPECFTVRTEGMMTDKIDPTTGDRICKECA